MGLVLELQTPPHFYSSYNIHDLDVYSSSQRRYPDQSHLLEMEAAIISHRHHTLTILTTEADL